MDLAPIALFVYNRPKHTESTLKALADNELADESDLFIFCDAAKSLKDGNDVARVQNIANNVKGFKQINVIIRSENLGLARSIISGVSDLVERFGKVIVLEDDLVSSRFFLKYMNDGLSIYRDNSQVASIHGYTWPISVKSDYFFLRGTACWGWGTWSRAWEKFEEKGDVLLAKLQERMVEKSFDFDNSYPYVQMLKDQISGKNDSWAVRWYASIYLADMLTLFSSKSHILNIGMDNSGTHSNKTSRYNVNLAQEYSPPLNLIEKPDRQAYNQLIRFHKKLKPGVLVRIIRKVQDILPISTTKRN